MKNKRKQRYLSLKLRKIEIEKKAIKDKFPDVDFDNTGLRSAMYRYRNLLLNEVGLMVDLYCCKSSDGTKRCSSCNCGKQIF